MNLYPKNGSPHLDPDLFANPTSEYRGAPFWSWNAKLNRSKLVRQIEDAAEMGFGGLHIHPRTGLDTEYLGQDFMDEVRACVEKAEKSGMLMWLYDEDRWPSGFAGGLVTSDPRFRRKHLRFTIASRAGRSALLARYVVALKNDLLVSYRRLADFEQPSNGANIWHAYLETAESTPWFNNQAYVDTLSREAIRKFVEVTHERYAAVVGDHFGTTIPAIFTDEPQVSAVGSLSAPTDTGDITIPFTDDFAATYKRTYGQDLLDCLPELFWELPAGAPPVVRYRFFDHVSECFASAFADTIGDWCSRHGIASTGHLMNESSLGSQSRDLGEAMRSYRSFHIPGIDMLCDWREYSTAKQAQSAAHQYGRPGVLSELYGVTNWDFDFVGHKAQGDWQAALGVTVRVPHLAWVSMGGEAKRDYPAAIDSHSPWYREYGLVENHFARLNTVLTRGQPLVRVGVIHPVESYWLCSGPLDQTKIERENREKSFSDIIEWLLFGVIDFDFICESLLPSQSTEQVGTTFNVGAMGYETVIVPALRTVRSTTLERLEKFAAAGGRVIFAGEVPSMVDAMPSTRAQKLAERCVRVEYSRARILSALEGFRDVEVLLRSENVGDVVLHQLRIDGARRHLFLCNTERQKGLHAALKIKGHWCVTLLDTLTGKTRAVASKQLEESTCFDWTFSAHGSALFTLTPEGDADRNEIVGNPVSGVTLHPSADWMGGNSIETRGWKETGRLADPVPVTLSEPNVLVLDQAQWRVNDEPWQQQEEILRIGSIVRERFGIPPQIAQPWTNREAAPTLATVSLKFGVRSHVDVAAPMLALEELAASAIHFDGEPVDKVETGWFVDESIRTVPLPRLAAGDHEIIIEISLTRKTNFEWYYLLGDFGVEVHGRHARLVAPVRQLAFGDWVCQGLPFYAGNVTYHCPILGADSELLLQVPNFKAPLLSVAMGGRPIGKIAFSPFLLELGKLPPGEHRLDITAYGNRVNAFGALHNCNKRWIWFGPNAWRTTGAEWAYEYQLKPMGILTAPLIKART